MLASCLTAMLLITVVTSAWLFVQRLSVRFRDQPGRAVDALAGRSGCHGCDASEDHCGPIESLKETTDAS